MTPGRPQNWGTKMFRSLERYNRRSRKLQNEKNPFGDEHCYVTLDFHLYIEGTKRVAKNKGSWNDNFALSSMLVNNDGGSLLGFTKCNTSSHSIRNQVLKINSLKFPQQITGATSTSSLV